MSEPMAAEPTDDEAAVVLAVDDEPNVTEAFALWLDDYTVRTAGSGAEALDRLDGVDVVLLDRRMPELSGHEVLETIRDRGYEMPVVMVTGVTPETDIADMPFDDYLEKPVTGDELTATVESVLRRRAYDRHVGELFSTLRKIEVLRANHSETALETNAEFQDLLETRDRLRREADEQLTALSDEERDALIRDF
ncbi:response regulator transcription factor [Halosegnis marinus]|uniref:Response regulator transcription factor n=1 Tax=Halosegnis marinus TaxID=3034023 RepID=A0ABD5ZQD6_9EURY|nr:response regulator [Halosegnis sp. DT85]